MHNVYSLSTYYVLAHRILDNVWGVSLFIPDNPEVKSGHKLMAGVLSKVEGRKICLDDVDRNLWADILARAAERFGWRVFAWCPLDNHYHLLQSSQGHHERSWLPPCPT